MLVLENITKIFNTDLFSPGFTAVDELSFSINEYSVTGFLGANGAGKTTSMKMIMDFIRPTAGNINFSKKLGLNKIDIFKKIGFLPERPYFYPNLTGRDFCFYMGSLSGLTRKKIIDSVKLWGPIFKIEFALDRELKTYSKGMLQRIGFLVTLLHDPELIILDEPLSGLDPIGRKELKDAIRNVNKIGTTVFFSSHIVSDVEEICSDLIFIKDGALFYEGTVRDILQNHSRSFFEIQFKNNNLVESKNVEACDKEIEIQSLINQGFEIISLCQKNPTLEEIIYDVKS